MREGFVFYRSFQDSISEMPEEYQLQIYKAIVNYGLNGDEPECNGVAKAIFFLIKPQIDANNKKYENGKKGGRPKENQQETKPKPNNNQNVTKTEPKEKDKVKDKVKDKENVKEKEVTPPPPKKLSFIAPTCDEVIQFFREKSYNAEVGKRAWEYYDTANWKDSKGTQVKNWKQKMLSVWMKPEHKIETVQERRARLEADYMARLGKEAREAGDE